MEMEQNGVSVTQTERSFGELTSVQSSRVEAFVLQVNNRTLIKTP